MLQRILRFTATVPLAAVSVALLGIVLLPAAMAQENDRNGDALEANEPEGAATPSEASRVFFEGIRAGEPNKVRRVVPPEERASFDRQGERLMEALTISELEVGETRRDEERPRRAYTYYDWDVEVDENEMIAAALDDLLESLRDAELAEEEIQRYFDEHGPSLRRFVRALAEQLRKPKQRMTLVQIDERWYVEEIADPGFDANEQAGGNQE